MDKLCIEGGSRLEGEITISGAKNSALPLMATAVMAETPLVLNSVPLLADTESMLVLLEHLGIACTRHGEAVHFSPATNPDTMAPYDIVRRMRASVLVLGPLLARYRAATVSLPGGCAIGTRPVDLHIKAMQALGGVVEISDGYIKASAPDGLKGGDIHFPVISVGATENAMMAAALADGKTQIFNAALEPEIIDLGECLIAMGAKIKGHGTQTITIEGVSSLSGCEHRVIPDRIEAGTFAIAAAMTGGEVALKACRPEHLEALWQAMRKAGAEIDIGEGEVVVKGNGSGNRKLKTVDITTDPYPGFPTDLQAQFMAMMCLADGDSTIAETIFENRFMHVPELARMGAQIDVSGGNAVVHGVEGLLGTQVMATDIRASVSLVLAGMVAEGETWVNRVYHLDRGYARLEEKLAACGAKISRISDKSEN